jgi:hypothetical protein
MEQRGRRHLVHYSADANTNLGKLKDPTLWGRLTISLTLESGGGAERVRFQG